MHQRLFKDHSETVAGMRCSRLMVNLVSWPLTTTKVLGGGSRVFQASIGRKGRWQLQCLLWLNFKCHWECVFPLFSPQPRRTFGQIFCGSLNNFGVLCLGLYRMIDKEERNPEHKREVCWCKRCWALIQAYGPKRLHSGMKGVARAQGP